MFIGHYALAFGAKRYAPPVSLGTLFLACQFADLLWPTLVVLGIFGPPPPNVSAVAMAGHLSWLFVAWAYWVDRHRRGYGQ